MNSIGIWVLRNYVGQPPVTWEWGRYDSVVSAVGSAECSTIPEYPEFILHYYTNMSSYEVAYKGKIICRGYL